MNEPLVRSFEIPDKIDDELQRLCVLIQVFEEMEVEEARRVVKYLSHRFAMEF